MRHAGMLVKPAGAWGAGLILCGRSMPVSREPFVPSIVRRIRALLRFAVGPERAPRVTDEDDDGLAGAPVPRLPKPVRSSGGAALKLPHDAQRADPVEAVSAAR
jgi:hypothetical protein